MAKLKLALAGLFSLLATVVFLRIVGQEIQVQRQMIELEKQRKEEAAKREAWVLPLSIAEPITVEAAT